MFFTNTIKGKMFPLLLAEIILQFCGANSFAGDRTYECKVLQVYAIHNGFLTTANTLTSKFLHESTFVVSKDTGTILGEYINTSLADSVQILERGSKNFNFRAIAEWDKRNIGGTRVAQLIEIRENDLGKPFTLFSAGMLGVLSGTCK